MANLTEYKGLNIVATPSGAAGEALTNDLKELADRSGPVYETAGDPTSNHDEADTASVGTEFEQWSKWRNTSNNAIFICVDPTEGAAVWVQVDGTGTGGTVQGTDGTYDIQAADDGVTAGDPRGESSVDLQTSRTNAAEVAQGDYSVIAGGSDNMTTEDFSCVPGGYQAKAEYLGGVTHATGAFVDPGDAQTSVLVARGLTVGDQTVTLTLEGEVIPIPTDKTITFQITVVARRLDAANEGAGWHFLGVVENNEDDVSLIGSVAKTEIANDNQGTWDVAVTANDTTDALDISCTGQTAKTVRWVARVELTEVCDSYGYSS